jgi:phage gpG-like protein
MPPTGGGLGLERFGAGMKFKFEILGEVQVAGFIAGIGTHCRDLRPIELEWADILHESTENLFASQGGDRPGEDLPWAKLKPSTLAHRLFPGKPILQQTEILKDSFSGSGADHVYRESPLGLEWGTRVGYAIYHQSPDARSGGLPRRPMIMVTNKDISRIISSVRRYIRYGK